MNQFSKSMFLAAIAAVFALSSLLVSVPAKAVTKPGGENRDPVCNTEDREPGDKRIAIAGKSDGEQPKAKKPKKHEAVKEEKKKTPKTEKTED